MPNQQQENSFDDFTLVLSERAGGQLVRSVRSPEGQAEEPALLDCSTLAPFARANPDTEAEAGEIGLRLMELLLPGDLGKLYQRVLGSGRKIRFLIELGAGSRYHEIPFELLHDGHRFLARNDNSLVVRSLPVLQKMPSPGVDPPLRVLFTSAAPEQAEPLDVAQEEIEVREALAGLGDSVDLEVRRRINIDELDEVYRGAKNDGQPFHVWHHAGHGRLGSDGLMQLVLHGDEEIPASRLNELVGQNEALRLAVINACHSGAPTGLASVLAGLDVPATIGVSNAVYDDEALRLPKALYPSLRKLSVEEAVSQARSRLNRSDSPVAWSRILLFSRYKRVGPLVLGEHDYGKAPKERVEPSRQIGRSHGKADSADQYTHKTSAKETIHEARGAQKIESDHETVGDSS